MAFPPDQLRDAPGFLTVKVSLDNPMRHTPVVFLVGGQVETRNDLIAALESAGVRVETFDSVEEFTSQYKGDEMGCLLLDWRPGDMNGAILLQRLCEFQSRLPLMVTIRFGDVMVAVECIRLGTVSLLNRPVEPQALLMTIHGLLDRASRVRSSSARLSGLTPREREILQLLIEGKSSKRIAAETGLSLRTVKNHRTHILAKTGAQNTADLVRLAMVGGITHAAG